MDNAWDALIEPLLIIFGIIVVGVLGMCVLALIFGMPTEEELAAADAEDEAAANASSDAVIRITTTVVIDTNNAVSTEINNISVGGM